MMKTRTNNLTWLVLIAGVCAAGPPLLAVQGKAVKEPRIYVGARTVDLGRIKKGDRGNAKWTIENRGTADLHILAVKGTCSCTVLTQLSDEERRLEPGEKVELEAVFDSANRQGGKERRGITVTTNDPVEPELQLFLTAYVVTLMEVSSDDRPIQIYVIGAVQPGTTLPKPIEVLPTDPEQSLEVTKVEILDDALSYRLEPLTQDSRTGARITLSVKEGSAIGRRIMGALTIEAKVDGQDTRELVRLSGEVVGDLEYSPLVLKQWQPVPHGTSLRSVKIKSTTGLAFEIIKIDAGEFLESSVKENSGGSEYEIEIRLGENAPAGPLAAQLDVYTNVVSQPLIRVPVFAHVRPRIVVDPEAVFVRGGSAASDGGRVVKIETAKRTPLELGEISSESGFVRATVVTTEESSRAVQYVRVEVNPGAPSGRHEDVLRISTRVPVAETVVIPVFVDVR